MRLAWLRFLLALAALLVLAPAAQATITCTSITSPGVTMNYVNTTTVSVQTFFAVTCNRSSTGDALSVNYSVKADNGGNPNGINNRATHASGTVLRYDFYTSASCGTQWKGNTSISDTITWSAGSTGSITRQTSFWLCVTTAQTATSSGVYSDSVGFTLTYPTNMTVSGSSAVAIFAPALCTVTTPPGNISLSNVAFGPQVSGSTSIGVTCTNGMPYVVSTDVPEAVLNGLRYVFSPGTLSANGSGALQTHGITATVPAGQAGTCPAANCNATRTHTLTITY
jgi:hypothetical protein